MNDIQSVYSISSVATEGLFLPSNIQSKVRSFGFSYSAFASSITSSGGAFFSEILFLYCAPRRTWRFMGVSVNHLERGSHEDFRLEELASSIFRTSPTEDIQPPWACIFAFCETALCSKMGRVVSPFVHFARNQDFQDSILVPLSAFDYQTMTWAHEVAPFSIPA